MLIKCEETAEPVVASGGAWAGQSSRQTREEGVRERQWLRESGKAGCWNQEEERRLGAEAGGPAPTPPPPAQR